MRYAAVVVIATMIAAGVRATEVSAGEGRSQEEVQKAEMTEFHIAGTVAADRSEVYVLDTENGRDTIATAKVKKGRFRIEGVAEKGKKLSLLVEGSGYRKPFFNDGEKMVVDLVSNKYIKASEQNKKLIEIDNKLDALDEQEMKYAEPILKHIESARLEPTLMRAEDILRQPWNKEAFMKREPEKMERLLPLIEEKKGILRKAVEENLDNLIPTVYYDYYVMLILGYDEEKELEVLKSGGEFSRTKMAKERVATIEERQAKEAARRAAVDAMIGKSLVDIDLEDMDGKTVKLSEMCTKGKYVLIDIWTTYCGPCRVSMPELAKALEKYKDKEFEILSVSVDDDRAAWKSGVERLGMTWKNAYEGNGFESRIAKEYHIHGVPTGVLIDPEGKIATIKHPLKVISEDLPEIFGN